MPSWSVSGWRKPIRTAPLRSRAASSAVGFCTLTTTSASQAVSASVAPASSYAASSNDAALPAPRSTTTSCPASTSLATTSGTSATRRSPGAVSFGTPILTRRNSMQSGGARRASGMRRARACGPAHDLDAAVIASAIRERDEEALERAVLERLAAEVAEQRGVRAPDHAGEDVELDEAEPRPVEAAAGERRPRCGRPG